MGCFNHDQYVEFTMHFRCNLHCEHCMIEGTMDRLEPESMERFQELLDYNRREQRWKALVLTGAEITLRRDLPDLARLRAATGSNTSAYRPMGCGWRTKAIAAS